MKGKQILITAPRQVRLADLDLPDDDLKPSEVIVPTQVTLLSGGTESAFFQGLPLPGYEPRPFPYPTGYANVGEVVAIGSSATGFALGDIVYTMSPHASRARVDTAERLCVKVPPSIPPEEAVFARLMTVPFVSVRTSRARAGDRAAVVGLGLVGNLGAQILQAAGMGVTGVDLSGTRRDLARSCGIQHVLDPREADLLRPEHTLVLEATGTAKGTLTAMALTQLGGEVSLVGTPWIPDSTVGASAILEPIHMRYITVRSGWEWQLPIHDVSGQRDAIHQPGSFAHSTAYAFDLLRTGKVRVRSLMTHRVAPDNCQEVYERALDRKQEQLGVIFEWG